jgi:ankyrin repeat protein
MYDHPEGWRIQRSASLPDNGLLLQAAKSGNLSAVKRLIKEGSDVNEQSSQLSTPGWTPTMLAFKESHLEIAEELISSGASVDQVARSGTTLLLEASEKGDLTFVKVALSAGAAVDATNNTVSNRYTVLFVASTDAESMSFFPGGKP